MVKTTEKVLQIRFIHVAHGLSRDDFRERGQCVMSAESRPATKRTRQKILFVDCCQNTGHTALQCPIGHTRNSQRPLLFLTGLRYEYPEDRRWSVSLLVDRTEHFRRPLLEGLFRFRHRLLITSRG